ncbi:zinc ribbon domain-containing protein [Nodosilinea sp. LEGE 07088]|uniref:zinc ribbon domain-containing protein n=1 Tax=Nodosilinea sp. LEGE 07088 TaxID=2777968 RepID=UPI00187FC41C|nr:zinc ribbon domain-containing protein [Nodosilinea sp. LEGE 07088]MBE9136815.1 zinc ribbon domain-containing protein [Nodosilinea sp. LEGE 07088]
MPYQYDFGPGQRLYLDNSGDITTITLASGSAGQQQQSSTQVQTGPWVEMPQIAKAGSGAIVRCITPQGTFIWQVQGMQIAAAQATAWPADQAQPMQPVVAMPPPAMQPMPPMQPMAPMQMGDMQMGDMQMGDMQMSANPMTMRMGNMTLGMEKTAAPTPSAQKFCTQCGAAVEPSDRFCGSCGHQRQ